MKMILMYLYNDNLPILIEFEDDKIVLKDKLKKENIDYILKYYNRLGHNFDERFAKIQEYNNQNNKLPIFLDDIRIKFDIKE